MKALDDTLDESSLIISRSKVKKASLSSLKQNNLLIKITDKNSKDEQRFITTTKSTATSSSSITFSSSSTSSVLLQLLDDNSDNKNDIRQQASSSTSTISSNLSTLSDNNDYSSTQVPSYHNDINHMMIQPNASIGDSSNETASTVDNMHYLKDFRDTMTLNNSTFIDYGNDDDSNALNVTDFSNTMNMNGHKATSTASTNNLYGSMDEEDEELRKLALSFTPGLEFDEQEQLHDEKINPTFYNNNDNIISIEQDDNNSTNSNDEIFSTASTSTSYDDDLSMELNRLSAIEEDLRLELENVSNDIILQQKQQQLYNIHSNKRPISPKVLTSLADESDDENDEERNKSILSPSHASSSSSIISTNIPFTYSTNEISTPTHTTTTCCTFSDFYNEHKKTLLTNNVNNDKNNNSKKNNHYEIYNDNDSPTPPSCLCM